MDVADLCTHSHQALAECHSLKVWCFLTDLASSAHSQRQSCGKGRQILAGKSPVEHTEPETAGSARRPTQSIPHLLCPCVHPILFHLHRERQRKHFSIVYWLIHKFIHIYGSLLPEATALDIEGTLREEYDESPPMRHSHKAMSLGGEEPWGILECTDVWIIYPISWKVQGSGTFLGGFGPLYFLVPFSASSFPVLDHWPLGVPPEDASVWKGWMAICCCLWKGWMAICSSCVLWQE